MVVKIKSLIDRYFGDVKTLELYLPVALNGLWLLVPHDFNAFKETSFRAGIRMEEKIPMLMDYR